MALLLCLCTLAATPAAHAGTALYQGSFADDDAQLALNITLDEADTLSARTLSYAGGSGQGQWVASGGFAPVLSLFGADGLLLQTVAGSASACGGNAADPASGFCWDAGFQATLVAGSYTLVLTQDGNSPVGPALAQGFAMTGSADYTGQAYFGQPGYRFINADGSQRDGHWALELAITSVPEPAAAALLLSGLLALAARSRRRRPGA